MGDPLAYYAAQGPYSDPGARAALLDSLPADVAALCAIVQGLLIHDHYGPLLHGPLPVNGHPPSRETLPVSERLDAILATCPAPLAEARPPLGRSVGTCRDFALLLCALLRHRAVPARVRCGFASYFAPGAWEDHWVCEYWNAGEGRWALADAQLDPAQRHHLAVDFDAADLPRSRFLPAWRAWRLCRSGAADPARFGHGEVTGEWFFQVNLARDLLALRKQEVSDWDRWRKAPPETRTLDAAGVAHCDRLAALAKAMSRGAPGTPDPAGGRDLPAPPPW